MAFWWAVFAMICWGIAPIIAKLGLAGINPLTGLVLRTLVAAGLVTGWVGLSGTAEQISTIAPRTWVLIGIEAFLATLAGDLAYYYAIKNGNVSLVSVIMSTSPLVTMIGAVLFLGEPVTVWRVLGACYIILGIIMLR